MKVFLVIALFFETILSYGQNSLSIQGIVVDSLTDKPIPSATVKVTYPSTDSVGTTSLTTDTNGLFTFRPPFKNNYMLEVALIGYKPQIIHIQKDSLLVNPSLNLGYIYLKSQQKELDEIVVTASKPRIRQEIDRLIYDVQADADSKSLSLLEFIRRVPLLSIDGEENLRLKGSGNYRIFVDGRPSSLFAHNAQDALKAMPASSVKRIEVITNPPSKYDAEGLAGIINLVLNKRLVDGYNASLGLSFNNTVGTGQDLTLTGKKGKFGITGRAYLFQDFKRYLHKEIQRSTSPPNSSFLHQEGIYSFTGSYFTENLELSYDADSLNLFTTSINFVNSQYDDQTSLNSTSKNAQQQIQQSYQALHINPQSERSFNLDFNYQRGFKNKKDRLLTFSYQYQNAPSNHSNEVYLTNKYKYPVSDYWQENHSGTKEQTFQVDYFEPSDRFSYDLGIKGIFRRNNSDYKGDVYDTDDENSNASSYIDDYFRYRQHVYSLYHSWHVKLKPFEIKTGLRLEHTSVDGDFVSQATHIHTQYSNFIPVVSLQRKLSNGAINLGYTQRITRPGITQLNPYVDRANPAFSTTGNPELKAVLKNNFELSYSAYGKGNMNISSSYSFSNNTIQQVSSFKDSVTYTTYENLGKDRSLGLNVSMNYPFTKNLRANINSELTYVWIEGRYDSKLHTNKGMQGYAYANLDYAFSHDWRASLSATFLSSNIYLQGSVNGYVNSSLRIAKDLLKKKLTIAASVSNPYRKYRYVKTKTDSEDFNELHTNQRFYRSFNVSINYNFGNLNENIRKNKRSIKNDDIMGK